LQHAAVTDVLEVVARNAEAFLAAVQDVVGQYAPIGLPQQPFRPTFVVAQLLVEPE
jgi:hypothetical protein